MAYLLNRRYAKGSFLLQLEIFLHHILLLTLHRFEDGDGSCVAGDVAAHIVALGFAREVVEREVVFHKERAVLDQSEVADKAVFLADGVDRERVFLLDRVYEGGALVLFCENDRRADVAVAVVLGRIMAVGAADDGVIVALLAHHIIKCGLEAVVREEILAAEHFKCVKGLVFINEFGVVLGELHHLAEPIGVREDAKTAGCLHLLVSPFKNCVAEALCLVLTRNALCALADHFLPFFNGNRIGRFAVRGTVFEGRTCLFLVLRGCNERVYAVSTAEIDVMDIVEGQMDLFTLNDRKVGKVAESIDGFKRGIVAVMVGNNCEVISLRAVVCRDVCGTLLAVRAAGVHMQVAAERKSARHILGEAVNGKCEFRLRRGIFVDVDVMLALALKEGRKAQASVAVGLGGQLASAASLGVDRGIGLTNLEDAEGINMILNEFRVQAERLNGDILLAVAEEYLGVNVVVVKNRFHCSFSFKDI